jgi:hypothetical protein
MGDLSILIPVYRYDCSQLVADLHAQGDALGVDYEVLVADDEKLQLGRARVRNHLAETAKGDKLLFIDCDAAVESPRFLKDYLEAAERAPVVVGGMHHADTLPSPDVSLRYRYEKAADRHRSADERNRHPYACFTTFSFLIDRKLFLDIRFDDACTDYGHEDTLFGAELERRGVPVLHIDNPLIHKGLEPNDVFLDKSRTALESLKRMETKLQGHSTLLRAYARLRRWHLTRPMAQLYRRFGRQWEGRLTSSRSPSLFLFKIYKLAYYCTL